MRSSLLLVAALIWASVMLFVPSVGHASDALGPNEYLATNEYLTSPNGLAILFMQDDGNLVLYHAYGSQQLAQWSTHTEGNPGAYAVMQASDGNLVVYDAQGNALWASNTVGAPNSFLAVQNDGNLVIYSPQSQARWATDTFYEPGLGPNQVLRADEYLVSPNGLVRLYMQYDGNLVLQFRYGSEWVPKWATGTEGHVGAYAVMQASDGNFVVYSSPGNPLWASNTAGVANSVLVVQNDGNLVIYAWQGQARWATNTFYITGLGPNQTIVADDWMPSPNRLVRLYMQADGNLVLLFRYGSVWLPQWATHTEGNPGAYAVMQASDGNFVVYGAQGNVLWASNTAGVPNCILAVQDDGNAVIYDPQGHVRWATSTFYQPGLGPNQLLTAGQYLTSPNGLTRLYMQDDGNLVLYFLSGADWVAQWATHTEGNPGAYAVMQASDGNFVVYSSQGGVLWASSTAGVANCVLIVQDDGNVVIYDPQGRARWATNTCRWGAGTDTETPYPTEDDWQTTTWYRHRGQLHAHYLPDAWPGTTYRLDANGYLVQGFLAPAGRFLNRYDLLDMYRARGYDFMAITEHEPDEKFDQYAWSQAFLPSHRSDILALVGSAEDTRPPGSTHILAIGFGDGSVRDVMRSPTADEQARLANIARNGGLAFVAHPDVADYWWGDSLLRSNAARYWGLELYNTAAYYGTLYSTGGAWDEDWAWAALDQGYAVDTWDRLLSSGAAGVRSAWGIAGDDYTPNYKTWIDDACIVVWTPSPTPDQGQIKDALKAGFFYACKGGSRAPEIFAYWADTGTRTVNVQMPQPYRVTFVRGRWGRAPVDIAPAIRGDGTYVASYTYASDDVYVRTEVRDSSWNTSWLQPIWIDQVQSRTGVLPSSSASGLHTASLSSLVLDLEGATITVSSPQSGVTSVNGQLLPGDARPSAPPMGYLSRCYQFTPDAALTGSNSLRIRYFPDSVRGFPASNLAIYRWDATGGTWGPLATTLDEVGGEVAASITRLGIYTVSAELPVDASAPAIVMTAPSAAALVSAPVAITANATDDQGVARVSFYLDGWPISTDNWGGDGFTTMLDPANYTAGPKTVAAVAEDGVGNRATAEATVDVAGLMPVPAMAIASPARSEIVWGDLRANGTWSGQLPLSLSVFTLDDQALTAIPATGDDWQIDVPLTFEQAGDRALKATGFDMYGNRAEALVPVTIKAFSDVPLGFWARSEIYRAARASIVQGYSDGTYGPSVAVTRDQMAVYIARAIAGGDANVPDPGCTADVFTDVSCDQWARKYIQYAVSQGVVEGYPEGDYKPTQEVDRGQMAVYVARSMVAPAGEAGLAGYVPTNPRNFPDVPSDFWAYKHVEYCVENGVVQGYDDGLYHPETVATRDQMAVYVARAFDLSL